LRQHGNAIQEVGLRVLVVTFETISSAKAYVGETELPWPLLVDESARLYAEYGMEQGSLWTVMGLHSWWKYISLLLRGRRLRRPTGNIQRLGGDILIDPTGMVRVHYVSQTPADRPSCENLLRSVRNLPQ
jgi:hypothetical protein